MIKIEIVQDFINPDEELTKEKCALYIRHINDTLKQARASIYNLFLGGKSLKYAIYILAFSLLLFFIFKQPFILSLTMFEIIGYLIISVSLSEYLTKKLKSSLKIQRKYFIDKLEKL